MCDYQGHEFGAIYLDSVCIDGKLWDADAGYAGLNGTWHYTKGGEIACPSCDPEGNAEYYRCDFCNRDERLCECQSE